MLFTLCVQRFMCRCAYLPQCGLGGQKTTCGSLFYLSLCWAHRLEASKPLYHRRTHLTSLAFLPFNMTTW